MTPFSEVEADFSNGAKLSSLANDAAEIEKTSGGFMEPGLKRKRGRPAGSKKKSDEGHSGQTIGGLSGPSPSGTGAAPSVDPIAELMPLTTALTSFYSGFLVQIAEDERARLDKTTSDTLSHTTAVCMNQYFPNAMGKHASLVVLLCIIGQTSFTAYQLRKENLAKLMKEAEAKRAAQAGQQPRPV